MLLFYGSGALCLASDSRLLLEPVCLCLIFPNLSKKQVIVFLSRNILEFRTVWRMTLRWYHLCTDAGHPKMRGTYCWWWWRRPADWRPTFLSCCSSSAVPVSLRGMGCSMCQVSCAWKHLIINVCSLVSTCTHNNTIINTHSQASSPEHLTRIKAKCQLQTPSCLPGATVDM